MTTKDSILISLSKFQATTAVIAQDLCLPPTVVAGFCEDLEAAGLIEHSAIGGHVNVWRNTLAGRQHVERFLPAKQSAFLNKP